MERRSKRSSAGMSPSKIPITLPTRGRPPTKHPPVKASPAVRPERQTLIVAEVEKEVVLNARGMPARQRKKNRFYYDEETMITPDTMAKSKSHTKKVKAEPVHDIEDEHEEDFYTETTYSTTHRTPVDHPTPSTSRRLDSSLPISRYKPRRSESTVAVAVEPEPLPRPIEKDPRVYADDTRRKRVPTRLPVDSIPASAATKVRGRAKKSLEEEEKVDIRKKMKPISKSPSEMDTPKKPKMQFIRIKREPDMSLGTPEHVVSSDYDGNYRQRRVSEKERPAQKSTVVDVRIVKRDYTDPTSHSAAMRSHFGQEGKVTRSIPGDTLERGGLDKKTAHDISIRLRNLLKLPKAHKWVCYEWFYSNVDKVLFEGENDFQICLKESFPQLKVRKMARVEWCKVRRLMGKPRRCSQSFFDEEREELMRRRQKIRMIQQRKMTDFNYKELPDEIPLQLVIGTKVTSRLRKPQDGLFTGTIDGVDTSNNTYRITFDRPGLGTHSIPDYEVLSNEPPETVSTSSFAMKIPRRNYGTFSSGTFKFQNPLLMGEEIPGFPKSPFPVDGMLGGFPIRLLDMIVRLSKLLKGKREKILHLKELNVEAEKLRSYGKLFNDDYRLRYARVVVDLGSMNKEMNMYLDGIQQYCLEIAPDHGSFQMVIPEHVQESCRQEAILLVDTYNTNKNRNMVQGNKSLQLIADMTSLLLQVKALSSGDRNLYELKSIKDTVTEIKASLGGKNLQIFQDRVEIPMNRIHAGLTLPAQK